MSGLDLLALVLGFGLGLQIEDINVVGAGAERFAALHAEDGFLAVAVYTPSDHVVLPMSVKTSDQRTAVTAVCRGRLHSVGLSGAMRWSEVCLWLRWKNSSKSLPTKSIAIRYPFKE